MSSKIASLKHVISLYVFIFVIWGFYRLFFKLPEAVEEIVLKPVLWLGPLLWVMNKEKSNLESVGWTHRNLFKTLYLSISIGILFAFEGALVNSIKYGGKFNFSQIEPNQALFLNALGLSLITAISEETVFRGFIFNRFMKFMGEWRANVVTSIMWVAVHIPVTIFVFKYTVLQLVTYLVLTFLFGLASAFVFARTKNVASSVLLHVFWEWPIVLFR